MPSLALHLGVALDSAPPLEWTEEELAGYLLGSTLPDISILLPLEREATHFVSLSSLPAEGEMEAGLLRAFGPVKGVERAVAAGYLCHLETDMLWVRDIFHPLFGPRSPLGGDPLAGVKDRALQYELDRRQREDRAAMDRVCKLIALVPPVNAPQFLGGGSLKPWQVFILKAMGSQREWDRFSDFARSSLVERGRVGSRELDEFLASLPEAVGTLMAYVGEANIQAFRARAVASSVEAVRVYLQ
jgi:hypothetical protein